MKMSYDILLIGFATLMIAIIMVFFFVMLFLYQLIKKRFIGEIQNPSSKIRDKKEIKPTDKKEKIKIKNKHEEKTENKRLFSKSRKEEQTTKYIDPSMSYIDMSDVNELDDFDEAIEEPKNAGKKSFLLAFSEKRRAEKIKKKEMKDQVARELEVWGLDCDGTDETEKEVEEPTNFKDKVIYLFQNTVWFKVLSFLILLGLLGLLVFIANPTYTPDELPSDQVTEIPTTAETYSDKPTTTTTSPSPTTAIELPKEDDMSQSGENKAMAANINNNSGQMANTTNSSQPLIAEPPQQQQSQGSTISGIPASYTGSNTSTQPSSSLGTLSIPSINLKNAPIMPSVSLADMAKGVGHFNETSLSNGNVGLAAHNNTFFQYLKDVNIGDTVEYTVEGVKKEYKIVSKEQIAYNDWSVLSSTDTNQLTMISCVRNQPEKRLAVFAVEVGQEANFQTPVQKAPVASQSQVNSGNSQTQAISNELQNEGYHDEGGGYSDYIGTYTGGY